MNDEFPAKRDSYIEIVIFYHKPQWGGFLVNLQGLLNKNIEPLAVRTERAEERPWLHTPLARPQSGGKTFWLSADC